MQGTGPFTVFVDANVWFSRTLRDWLGMLYTTPDTPPFVVHWSEDVLAELIHHLRKQNPEWPGGRITQLRDRLAGTFEAGRVDEYRIDATFRGRDAGDTHVHAAALACQADALVTCNVRDFVWDENTSPYDLLHPDDFLVLVDDADPLLVAEVTGRMCDHWMSRRGEANLPAALSAAGCPRFAQRVLDHLHQL